MNNELNQRKFGAKQKDLSEEYVSHDGKRAVPEGLRKFLDLDAELTKNFTSFMQSKLPNITKSETKFMEISGSGYIWLPVCAILYFMHPFVPKQLPINLIMAFVLDIVVIGLLKAFARRRRPPTRNPDFFKSIGPDQFSFPSGHASRTILIAFIFSLINPFFDIGYLNFGVSLLLWGWSLTVCLSRILNGRHYLFDVLVGATIGFVEGYLVSFLWMSPERAENILNFFSDEAPEI
ncbi:phospholipid phosphatase 6-like [Daphnia pulex]|uniref:phospholipid phosphatase 6-like n=1 Tax=Daphnia pulex TaxID=6669 RepID=UPI001EDF687D|nr:phospholipid phosphatase 6-like [Daphnia pulex]